MTKAILFIFCMTLSTYIYAGHSHAEKGKNGGLMVDVKGTAKLEVIHDAEAKKLTIMVFDKDGKVMAIENAPRMNITSFTTRKQCLFS